MAANTERELLELEFRLRGESEMRKAATLQTEFAMSVGRAKKALDETRMSQEAYDRHVARAAQGFVKQKAVIDHYSAALGSATGKTKNFGYAAMNASQMVQDFQAAGLRGVTNQIGLLTTQLGGSAGLGAALLLAGVGFQALEPHIWKMADALANVGLKTEADRMAELAEETRKTADEMKRLADYEQRRSQSKAQEGRVPKAEQEARKAVGEAIGEAGGSEGLITRLQGAFLNSEGLDPSRPGYEQYKAAEASRDAQIRYAQEEFGLDERVARMDPSIGGGIRDAEEKMAEARQTNLAEARNRASEVVRRAEFEQPGGGLDALIRHMEAQPEQFAAEVVDRFREAGPEARNLTEELLQTGAANEAIGQARQKEAEREAADIEDYIAEDEKESERRLARRGQATQRRDKDIEGLAGTLMADPEIVAGALGDIGELTPEDVRSRLEQADVPDAAELAEEVWMAIMMGVEERVSKEALGQGIDPMAARDDLRFRALEEAGIPEPGEGMVGLGMAGGGRRMGRMERLMRGAGMIGRGPARDGVGGHFAGEYGAVQTMGAESFAGQVQAMQPGQDDTDKKQLDELKELKKKLEEIVNNTRDWNRGTQLLAT